MKHEPIPILSFEEIEFVVFNPSKTMDERRTHLFSAFYNLEIETVDKLLSKALKGEDLDLKLCALRTVDAFIQSRQATFGIPNYLRAIEDIISTNPKHKEELAEIAKDIEEFDQIFSTQKSDSQTD